MTVCIKHAARGGMLRWVSTYVVVFTDLKDDFRSIMRTLENLRFFALIHVRWLPSLIRPLGLFLSAMYSFYLMLFRFI